MNSSVLPQSVVQRLQNERARIENGAFSSALGVGEMLLARQSGYRPLGQVMGASIYRFNGQREFANWRDINWRDADSPAWRLELTTYTNAMRDAFDSALQRLRAEASALEADGVFGVRARIQKPRSLHSDQIECVLVGTAVKRLFAMQQSVEVYGPFTSNLSGEETWKLERAGYSPCALVFDCCALLQTLSGTTRDFIASLYSPGNANYEYEEYTQAIYAARETVVQRLETRAQNAGATAILNVQIELEEHLKVDPSLPGVNFDTPHQVFALIAQGTAMQPRAQARPRRIVPIAPLT